MQRVNGRVRSADEEPSTGAAERQEECTARGRERKAAKRGETETRSACLNGRPATRPPRSRCAVREGIGSCSSSLASLLTKRSVRNQVARRHASTATQPPWSATVPPNVSHRRWLFPTGGETHDCLSTTASLHDGVPYRAYLPAKQLTRIVVVRDLVLGEMFGVEHRVPAIGVHLNRRLG